MSEEEGSLTDLAFKVIDSVGWNYFVDMSFFLHKSLSFDFAELFYATMLYRRKKE